MLDASRASLSARRRPRSCSIGIIGAARCGLRSRTRNSRSDASSPPPKATLAVHPSRSSSASSLSRVTAWRASVWKAASWTAQELLSVTAEDEEELTALGQARVGCARFSLTGHAGQGAGIEALTVGIAIRTYYAARQAERIVASKEQTANGPWILTLPQVTPAGPLNVHAILAIAVVPASRSLWYLLPSLRPRRRTWLVQSDSGSSLAPFLQLVLAR